MIFLFPRWDMLIPWRVSTIDPWFLNFVGFSTPCCRRRTDQAHWKLWTILGWRETCHNGWKFFEGAKEPTKTEAHAETIHIITTMSVHSSKSLMFFKCFEICWGKVLLMKIRHQWVSLSKSIKIIFQVDKVSGACFCWDMHYIRGHIAYAFLHSQFVSAFFFVWQRWFAGKGDEIELRPLSSLMRRSFGAKHPNFRIQKLQKTENVC